MESYKLPFATFRILRPDIVEVIVNEGVEMSVEMVEQYHEFLLSHLRAPFCLLVNKINAYTYAFDAQSRLAELEEIQAVAVVAYSKISILATESLHDIPRKIKWNMQIFTDRDDALQWLFDEQRKMLREQA